MDKKTSSYPPRGRGGANIPTPAASMACGQLRPRPLARGNPSSCTSSLLWRAQAAALALHVMLSVPWRAHSLPRRALGSTRCRRSSGVGAPAALPLSRRSAGQGSPSSSWASSSALCWSTCLDRSGLLSGSCVVLGDKRRDGRYSLPMLCCWISRYATMRAGQHGGARAAEGCALRGSAQCRPRIDPA